MRCLHPTPSEYTFDQISSILYDLRVDDVIWSEHVATAPNRMSTIQFNFTKKYIHFNVVELMWTETESEIHYECFRMRRVLSNRNTPRLMQLPDSSPNRRKTKHTKFHDSIDRSNQNKTERASTNRTRSFSAYAFATPARIQLPVAFERE